MRHVVPPRRLSPLALLLGWLFAVESSQAVSADARSATEKSATHSHATALVPQSRKAYLDVTTLHWRNEQAYVNDTEGRPNCLSLDYSLQQSAFRHLRTANPQRGAIVVLRVNDGSVLAAADFPPLTPRERSVLWSALTPSASLFKLVTTAALVEVAKIRPEHRVCSEGGEHRIGLEQLEAPKHGKVRCQPFSSILATSRNAAYARLVTSRLKSDELTEYAKRFGFNNVRTSELPIELGHYHPAYGPLDLARTATGFVGSSLSTFGAAYLGFVIANGGFNKPIQLVCSQQERDDLDSVEQVLSTATAKRLREMMEAVVRHGTAYEAFYDATGHPRLPGLSVAGKTGTLGHDEGTNSWFTGFAPSRNPKFVVAVLLDNGAVYRTTAKNVAVEMLRDLFPPQTPPSSPVRTTLKGTRSVRR